MTATHASALERLYREHGDAVHRVAAELCGPALAADVTQDVFVQLWNKPEAFDPLRGSMRAFLVTAARHRAIDLLRSEGSRRDRELGTSRAAETVSDLDHDFLAQEVSTLVVRALEALTPAERDAIVTAFFGGCTYREVALLLGVPEGTIKSRIRSGLQRLRAPLRELVAAAAG